MCPQESYVTLISSLPIHKTAAFSIFLAACNYYFFPFVHKELKQFRLFNIPFKKNPPKPQNQGDLNWG